MMIPRRRYVLPLVLFTALHLAGLVAAEEQRLPADGPPTEQAQTQTKRNTAGLDSPRATMERFLAAANASDYAKAAECLDLSDRSEPDSEKAAATLAWKLKEVLDRLAVVDVEAISADPGAMTYVLATGRGDQPIVIDQCADGAWRFSLETVAAIDPLYEWLKDDAPVAGRNWLRDLFPASMTGPGILLPHYQWMCLLLIIFLGIVVDYLARFVMYRLTLGWFTLRKIDVDQQLERGLWKPVGLLIRALVWYGGTVVIGLRPEVLQVLLVAVRFFAIAAAVWTAFLLIDLLSSYLMRKAAKTATRFDDLIVPLVSRSLKVFAVCVGLLLFAEAFDLPLTGLLGGMGLGGVAVAFAAKDTVGNLFGSLTVLVDRPFEIGDWIKTDKVEGTVETVGIRSTRVRTFYNSLVTLPNSLLTTAIVDNMGKRSYRRIKTMLGLQYDTPPERIDAFCEGVRELLRRHPYTRKDYYHVYLNRFSDSSLDVLLYCFIECPDWAIELRERHRLFLDILKLAQRLGVSFAFPTRTLHMFQGDDTPPPELSTSNLTTAGRRLAAEITGPPLPRNERPGAVRYVGPYDLDEADGDGEE